MKIRQKNKNKNKILTKILNIFSENSSVKSIKQLIIREIGTTLNLQHSYIYELQGEIFHTDKNSQHHANNKTACDKTTTQLPSIINEILAKEQRLIINSREELEKHSFFQKNEDFINHLKEQNITSIAIIPIEHRNKMIGLFLLYDNKENSFLSEEIEILRLIASLLGTVLNENQIYKRAKKENKTQAIIHKIINIINKSLNLDIIKSSIAKEVGQAVKADICTIRVYNEKTETLSTSDKNSEYLKSELYKNRIDNLAENKIAKWILKNVLKKKKITIISDLEEKENIPKYIYSFLKKRNIKTVIAVPMHYQNKLIGGFFIHYINEKRKVSGETILLLKLVAEQAAIALVQAKILKEKESGYKSEKLIREVIEAIRSTLDIQEAKKIIVKEVGKTFHADRCYFRNFNKKTNRFESPDVEYKSSSKIKSLLNKKIDQKGLSFFVEEAEKQKNCTPLIVNQELIEKKHPKNTQLKKYFEDCGIKTDIAIPMWDNKNELSFLVLHYTKNISFVPDEDLRLMEILAKQVIIAIDQAGLFLDIQKQVYKESVLKEILSEIKPTRNLDEAYKKLLKKIALTFKVKRVLFLEASSINPEALVVKYQHCSKNTDLLDNTTHFPRYCIKNIPELIKNMSVLAISNTSKCDYEESAKSFYRKHNIKAIMLAPLVKYNGNTKTLGFTLVCSETERNWSEEEKSLLKNINESTIVAIWEIIKFTEIEELRNSFVLTLAHDFQVPLIGEQRAIEFLIQIADQENFNYKDILQELLENNVSIVGLLNKSIDIYNYESGEKTLELEKLEIADILITASRKFQDLAKEKCVKLSFEQKNETMLTYADFKEILKAIQPIIENAIENSKKDDSVQIKYRKRKDNVIIAISNPEMIPIETQKKIFKRYEMLVAIERKIGSGTGLFLSKKIIEAHSGAIWFDSDAELGTTFNISLPLTN